MFAHILHRIVPTKLLPLGYHVLAGPGFSIASLFVLAIALLTACGGNDGSPAARAAEPRDAAAQEEATDADGDGPCADLSISIGELAQADAEWPAELATMQARGSGWQPDADLVQIEMGCSADIFFGGENDGTIAWDGIFDAPGKGNWHSADGTTYMVLTETPLDPSLVSFAKLRDWLAAAGYDDDTRLFNVAISHDANVDGTPEEHFSYRVDQFPTATGTVVRMVVDGIDGTVTEQEI